MYHPHMSILYLCTLPKRTLAAVIEPVLALQSRISCGETTRVSQTETCSHRAQLQRVALQTPAAESGCGGVRGLGHI